MITAQPIEKSTDQQYGPTLKPFGIFNKFSHTDWYRQDLANEFAKGHFSFKSGQKKMWKSGNHMRCFDTILYAYSFWQDLAKLIAKCNFSFSLGKAEVKIIFCSQLVKVAIYLQPLGTFWLYFLHRDWILQALANGLAKRMCQFSLPEAKPRHKMWKY